MLQPQVVPINFGEGVETKTDSKMTLPGTLTTLENGIFTKAKRISKRNGYDKLGEAIIDGASSIGVSQALGVFKPAPGIEELIQFSGSEAYSYSTDQSKWIDKDACQSVILKYKSIIQNYDSVLNGDVAVIGNLECYVWRDSTIGYAGGTVIDSNTGAEFFVSTLNTSIGRSRVVAIGTKFYIFYVRPTSGNVVFRSISTSAPQTISGETTIGTADLTDPAMDVVSDGTNMWLAYYDGSAIQLKKLDSTGTSVATASISTTVAFALTLRVNSNVFVYWYNSSAGTQYAVRSSTLTSVLGATVIDSEVSINTYNITAIDTSTTSQKVFYTNGPVATTSLAASAHKVNYAVVGTAGVTTAASALVRSVGVSSKAFTYGGNYYFFATHRSDLQSTLFLFRSDGVCIGRSFEGLARGSQAYSLGSVVAKSATKFIMPQAVFTAYSGTVGLGGTANSGISALTVDFSNANAFQNAMLGGNLHMVGGFLSMYDGRTIVEHGFHLFPEDVAATPSASGGFLSNGAVQIAVIYEWIDNVGQKHRSAPSVPLAVTLSGGGSNQSIALAVPTLRITEKKGAAGEVAIQIFMTEPSGTIFYNVKAPTAAILYNDTTVDFVSYTITSGAITANEILYTVGDVLENNPAPSCSLIDVYQSRAVISGLRDPLELQYSKVQVKGEGVAFSSFFTMRLDPFGGDISTVKLMDDKIIAFKENAIFYVSGEGPADTGSANNYSLPQLVTADSGCPYPKSAVLMPLGIMYKSNKGIYLLNRSLQVEYIGSPVEDYNAQDITSAELIQDKNQVRFLTSSGVTLVYDYFFKQWSTFTNHEGVDAAVWQGVYTYLRNNGQVYKESTSFLDNTTGIVLKAATAWLKFAGIQGFQRVWRIAFLGEYKSAHQLQVRVGYDYKPAYVDTYTFDATTVIASSANPYEFRQSLRIQKCAALRFEFSDILPVSPGESYNMSDLSLEVGIKGGVNRLRSAQSI